MRQGTPQDCPFRYPGQYEDTEIGLYYNRFRYYDPEVGHYLSQDPLGLAGGPALYYNRFRYYDPEMGQYLSFAWQTPIRPSRPQAIQC